MSKCELAKIALAFVVLGFTAVAASGCAAQSPAPVMRPRMQTHEAYLAHRKGRVKVIVYADKASQGLTPLLLSGTDYVETDHHPEVMLQMGSRGKRVLAELYDYRTADSLAHCVIDTSHTGSVDRCRSKLVEAVK